VTRRLTETMDDPGGLAGGTGDGDPPVAGSRLSITPRLAPGAEFDLIRSFFAGAPSPVHPAVTVGVGDDCAVVNGDGIVLGTDLSVEDIHFRRSWLTPREIGYRAAAAALSDLAAMAARPIGVLASLAVQPSDTPDTALELMAGVRAAVETLGGVLLGGDLTRSPGPIFVDVVGVGQCSAPVLRSGAMPGDEIWVTGTLGAAAAAVRAWRTGEEPDPDARRKFAAPRPRVEEAMWLAERAVPKAMLDLSDGLGGDAGHLAVASGVSIVLSASRIPISAAAERWGPDEALALALSGGEDFELCFAARPGSVDAHLESFHAAFGLSLTRVGEVVAGKGVQLEAERGERRSLSGGFQHFGRE
jgi:thiamine-monophosphate kinase